MSNEEEFVYTMASGLFQYNPDRVHILDTSFKACGPGCQKNKCGFGNLYVIKNVCTCFGDLGMEFEGWELCRIINNARFRSP